MDLNFKRYSKITFINLIVLLLIFSILEIISRLLYPSLVGEVFKNPKREFENGLTRGIVFWEGKFNQNTRLSRVSHKEANINNSNPLFIILGDSISGGFGSAYEDIYWTRLQRKYDLDKRNKDKITFLSIGSYGNNLEDSDRQLNEFINNNNNSKIKYIFYQFNFNDVMPFSKQDIKAAESKKSPFLKFSEIRYQYLNRSTFLRILQFYSTSLFRKTKGSCDERGLDAMGSYTWTFANKTFKKESMKFWENYENNLINISKIAKKNNAKFIIFTSPIIYDIDSKGVHPFYNRNNLDFSCATIDPKKKLKSIANNVGAQFIDPTQFVKDRFERRVREGNFTPFYFPGDNNHFAPIAGEYIADFLYFSIFRDEN